MIQHHIHTLKNGLRVVTVEMPHLHSAELAIYIKAGGRNDPKGKEGLSHFLEHILFRGSEQFPSSQHIENAFEEIGGAPNASTDADSTCFYSRLHPDHTRRGMEIFASMIMQPLLTGIDVEKRIIAEEAREDLNEEGKEINPDTVVSRLLWPRHPLGMPTVGTLESIGTISYDDLNRHLRQLYRPANAVLIVSGQVNNSTVVSEAEEMFGRWESADVPVAKPVALGKCFTEICLINDSDSQVSLQMAFLGFGRHDSRVTPLRLIRRILAGGGSSRLYLKLREELGIIYSVEAAIGSYDETGCIAIDLSTSCDTLLQAIDMTLKELLRLCQEPVADSELNRIKQSYRFDLEYSRDSAFEMGGRYGWGGLMGVMRSIEEDQREVFATTPEQIGQIARALFNPDNLKLVAVGPMKRGMKKRIQELLEAYRSELNSIS